MCIRDRAKTVYTFTMPDGDVTISVTKAAKTYAVKVADANKDTLKITSCLLYTSTRRFAINTCKVPHICRTTFHTKGESSNT